MSCKIFINLNLVWLMSLKNILKQRKNMEVDNYF